MPAGDGGPAGEDCIEAHVGDGDVPGRQGGMGGRGEFGHRGGGLPDERSFLAQRQRRLGRGCGERSGGGGGRANARRGHAGRDGQPDRVGGRGRQGQGDAEVVAFLVIDDRARRRRGSGGQQRQGRGARKGGGGVGGDGGLGEQCAEQRDHELVAPIPRLL